MLVKLLLLLVALSFIPETAPCYIHDRGFIEVEYHGMFKCRYKKNFCALIYYVERDSLTSDDDLDFVPIRCTTTGRLEHHIFAYIRNDDGFQVGSTHEPAIEVYSNCEDTGRIMQFKYDLPEIDASEKYASHNYTLWLYEEQTDEYDRKKARRYWRKPNEDTEEHKRFFDGYNMTGIKKLYKPEDEPERLC